MLSQNAQICAWRRSSYTFLALILVTLHINTINWYTNRPGMRQRKQNFGQKAVYYRKNYVENGKSKSKWVKIEGVTVYPFRSTLKVDEILIDNNVYDDTSQKTFTDKFIFSSKR